MAKRFMAISVLGLIPSSACVLFPKPAPPVAPCVYVITEGQSGDYYPRSWDAEDDLKISGSTVKFTNCYSGQPVILHGTFSIERISSGKRVR